VLAAPDEERVLVVGRAAEDDGRAVREGGEPGIELEDFRRADEGEIPGIGVENRPIAREVVGRDASEFAIGSGYLDLV